MTRQMMLDAANAEAAALSWAMLGAVGVWLLLIAALWLLRRCVDGWPGWVQRRRIARISAIARADHDCRPLPQPLPTSPHSLSGNAAVTRSASARR